MHALKLGKWKMQITQAFVIMISSNVLKWPDQETKFAAKSNHMENDDILKT